MQGNNVNFNSFDGINNNFSSPDSFSDKISKNLKICVILLIILSFLRICAFQFFWMINDLLAALVVFCTYSSRGKIMAIFCLITGIMGVIYAVSITPMDLKNNSGKAGNTKLEPTTSNSTSSESTSSDTNSDLNFNILNALIIINLIFAVITYTAVSYFSYQGIMKFESEFEREGNFNQSVQARQNTNYGAIETNNTGGFVAFGGRGTQLGGGDAHNP